MKNFFRRAAALLTMIVLFSSCEKEKGSSIPVNGIIISGSWKISYFIYDGNNRTYYYDGYTFIFNTNDQLTCTCANGTTTGTWKADSNGADKIRIDLGNNYPYEELSGDWIIKSVKSSLIELSADSAADTELHFEKK